MALKNQDTSLKSRVLASLATLGLIPLRHHGVEASFRWSSPSLWSPPPRSSHTTHAAGAPLNPACFTHLPYLPGACMHLGFYHNGTEGSTWPRRGYRHRNTKLKIPILQIPFNSWERIFIISLIMCLLHFILSSVLHFQELS